LIHSGTVVSDEIWRQLDPGAGRLSWRTATRLWLVGGLIVVVGALGYLVWDGGYLLARLEEPSDHMSLEVYPGRSATYHLEVTNAGRVPVTITGAGGDAPGLQLVRVDGALPVELAPGRTAFLGLVYRVTDCAARPGPDDWPVPVTVDGPWFPHTVQTFRRHEPAVVWPQKTIQLWCQGA
jgi:hypothetical protein